jgi:hypothetical protein
MKSCFYYEEAIKERESWSKMYTFLHLHFPGLKGGLVTSLRSEKINLYAK